MTDNTLTWRSHDWAGLGRTVDVGPDRLAYVDLGEGGTPVLLLHGLGGNWTAWLETLPALAPERRVLAVDLPGFGASAPGSDGISIPGYARTIERFCARMGLDEVDPGRQLAGWLGGRRADVARPRAGAGSRADRRRRDRPHPGRAPEGDLDDARRGARRAARAALP